ncbi:Fe-S cluster assembly ATPase SufC [Leptonema illini]|jgi:Fe-S cluster assembly ATP-binding protein|uniref:FeS assembly ATPase SufC n=1 Tax=Leptonema illini DSM 21528 TaxID=929563 RepID=H2CHX7_9LEPT|nr:Fe-S cluster assembly ATPase SufC [Leptonema illini]EHQ06999.1 FeS assembly ATPase SufC [Leptonema illini DSM 21528]
MNLLEIKNLHAEIDGKPILNGVDLVIPAGQSHAVMGPNGSGKSTLSYVLLGHPKYTVTKGDILFKGESIVDKTPDERARLGMFLSLQYPTSIPGVTGLNFLKNVLKNIRGQDVPVREFRKEVNEALTKLDMKTDFMQRYVNDGFSGGEKKRNEILQMSLIQPALAILDEIDSGLDVDALRIIAQNIEAMRSSERSMLLITHYQRLLSYLTIDRIHIFVGGTIRMSGGKELAKQLEESGYERLLQEA